MKINNMLLNNLWLKLLSLFLAFITLLYVGETTKSDSEDRPLLQKLLSRSDIVSKTLAVQPIFVGSAPAGYRLEKGGVKAVPESIVVIGPARYLSDKENLFTKPIDLSEHTKAKAVAVDLESISRSIKSQELKVQVYLPIEKVEE